MKMEQRKPEEIWREACERVGIGRCTNDNCKVRTVWTTTGYMVQPYHPPHGPPIGDPAATLAMQKYARRHQQTLCLGPSWVIIHDLHGLNLAEGDMRLGEFIALATAVCALPKEKP